MAEFRNEFLHELMGENENFSKEEFRTKLREYLEQGERAAAPAAAAPVEIAPAPSGNIGVFMPSTALQLRDRRNLAMFLQRFYTWASVAGCDSALDSDVTIKTSGTPRAELERLYNRALVQNHCKCGNHLQKC